jgi:hypothetical protein
MLRVEKPIPEQFPKQEFRKIEKLGQKLTDLGHTYGIYDQEIVGKNLDAIVDLLYGELSKAKERTLSRESIYTTVTELAGKVAKKELMREFFFRVAANANRLYKHQALGLFNPARNMGWAVIEFIDMMYYKQKDSTYIKYIIEVKSGLGYGHQSCKVYAPNSTHIDALLYRLGAAGKGSTSAPRELVQLRFWGELIQQHNNAAKEVTYGRWTIDKQLKAYNSKIIRERRRHCPENYKWACAKCPMGYYNKDAILKDISKENDSSVCHLACRRETNKEKVNELRQRIGLPLLWQK